VFNVNVQYRVKYKHTGHMKTGLIIIVYCANMTIFISSWR